VSRYFPAASHQVVLLSTDEEVDDRYYKQLRPWVGRTYRLEFDPGSGGTRPVAGYFW
jgi:DNA sulfur modification protein DndD